MATGDVAPGKRLRGERIDDRRVLAMDLEHPAEAAHGLQGGEQPVIGQAEVEDHECLGGGDARRDELGQLAHRIRLLAGDHRAQAVVNRGLALGAGAELAHAGHERRGAVLGDARAGVVEGEERGRAAERGGQAVREEPIRLVVGGDAGVGVHVHAAGQDEQAGGIDDFDAGLLSQRRSHGADPPIGHRDVGLERVLGGDDGAAGHHQVGHRRYEPGCSVISMSWAPSHRTRRPSSGSWSAPSTMVAKWLPASGPSLLENAQAPYGTRISHSDRSPV